MAAEKKANPDTYDGYDELRLPTEKSIVQKYLPPPGNKD